MIKVGVIGCGAMGQGMVKNLIKNGYDVYVYDLNPAAVKVAAEYGAQPKSSIQAVAEEVQFLLTSLPHPDSLEEAIIGETGALGVMQRGAYILDMGTTDVQLTRRLYNEAAQYGIAFYDCPVSGGPQGAANGSMTIMVGGNEESFSEVRQVLEAIGQEIIFIGQSGSGQVVKLCNNMVVAGLTILLSEALLTGGKAGVSPDIIADVMQKGSAQNKVLSVFGPNLLQGTFDHVIFLLSHMAKDIDLYIRLAKEGNIPHFMGSLTHQLYEVAKIQGKGGLDSTAVGQVLEELAQHKIAIKQ